MSEQAPNRIGYDQPLPWEPRASPDKETITCDRVERHPPASSEAASQELVGTLLAGRYQIEKRIGMGGMGIVYAALDVQLGRRVAIKLLRPRVEDDTSRTRFVREAQAMGRLRHANVVTLHDIGTLGERMFLVMELVDGGTLAAWLKQQARTWREVVSVFTQAAAGLSAAHAASFVHRDFKPENVLLCSDGIARVSDFGVARMVGEIERCASEDAPAAAPCADTGGVVGTPGYIAPEILRRERFDERTDQFSFCVALHEALLGRKPFDAAESHGRVSRVSDRVPRWLMRVVQRGLSADPALRWPTLDALAAVLRRRLRAHRRAAYITAWAVIAALVTASVVIHETLSAEAEVCRGAERKLLGVWDEAHKRGMHNAFLATGKSYAEIAFQHVGEELDRDAAAWIAMHTEACRSTRVRGEQSEDVLDLQIECLAQHRTELKAQVEILLAADADVVTRALQMTRGLLSLRQCADIAALRAPVRAPADPATRARVREVRERLAKARALQAVARAQDGLAIAAPAAADARELGYRPLEAEALYQLGLLQRLADDASAGRSSLERAILAARAGRDARTEVLIAAALVSLAANQAKLEDAHGWMARGLAAVEAMASRDPEAEAYLLTSAGEVAQVEGNFEAGLAYDRRALALREKVEPPDSVLLAAARMNLGRELMSLDRLSEAKAEILRALTIFESRLGSHHPKVAWGQFQLAYTLSQEGSHEQAIASYRSSVATYEATLGPSSAELALPLTNLGDELARQGKYEESMAQFRRALAITSISLGPEHPKTGLAVLNIGEVLVRQHKLVEADAAAQRALAIFQKAYSGGHRHIALAMKLAGDIAVARGEPKRAIPWFEQAVRMAALHAGERAELCFDFARALWDAGQDRVRAHQLGAEARSGFAQLGPGHDQERREVEAWMDRHR